MNMMDTTTLVSPNELIQRWAELAQDEQSPDYYELTEYGELVLSPKPTNRHQRLCTEIAFQLRSQLGGEAVVEAAILTGAIEYIRQDGVHPTSKFNLTLTLPAQLFS